MAPRPSLLRRSHELGLAVTVALVAAVAPEFEAAHTVHADDRALGVALGPNFDPLPIASALYMSGQPHEVNTSRAALSGERFSFYR
jgi:hypothetical protein